MRKNQKLIIKNQEQGVFKCQKGAAALLLVILIMVVILAIGLSLSGLGTNQIKMSSDIGKTTQAFYAADAGIEQCIYQEETGSGPCASVEGEITVATLDNGATYSAKRESANTISALGQFRGTSRKIEVSW